MFKKVSLRKINFKKYQEIISPDLFSKIEFLGRKLKNKKIIHVNSTSQGGGVAEILKTLIPLEKSLGINAQWLTVSPKDEKFFYITKKIHDTLQGEKGNLTPQEKEIYLKENKYFAHELGKLKADYWVIHDPQPLPVCCFNPNISPAVSRIHIDLSKPNQKVANFIFPYLKPYKRAIFSLKEFIAPNLPKNKVRIFPPAIDPLSVKNKPMNLNQAKNILSQHGINIKKPLIAQVSRFDIWKDPIGVVKAYYLAKKEIPDLQLILAGFFQAKDDPNGEKVYSEVKKYIKNDPNIFLFAHLGEIKETSNEVFINAVQTGADVILQKSIKEGFGLTVTEGMWKRKPVIGGNVGGIKLQIKNGQNGFLVDSYQQAAEIIIKLIKNPSLTRRIGKKAHQRAKDKFLMPRLLKDHLKILNNIKK